MIVAGAMLLAFLLILAILEISIDVEVKDEKSPNTWSLIRPRVDADLHGLSL